MYILDIYILDIDTYSMQNFKEYQFFYCTDYKITYNYELNSILFNFGSSNFHANHYNNISYSTCICL